MSVAAPAGYVEDKDNTLRVATKFVNAAKKHYAAKNRDVEIIKLNGSIELGPILGLSHVIVDIVETGNTLKANNLEVIEQFQDVSDQNKNLRINLLHAIEKIETVTR